jgi:hypothetical protein
MVMGLLALEEALDEAVEAAAAAEDSALGVISNEL